ncbi:hypothetical protein PHAVU_003G237000 [Phaseolus vulgaris]|uniref:Uncharacterized protein n=1 Tax=Phaseolus vulgaris TaxID=3885 RepID=V7CEZ3_PHAVU|nr:hypothetical protein PHAVU_003G237000g [Phaseolus vulgaris]ESW27845.1 hypothetical protein PHAVU_003G237000g [Phaseolus vulgaris]
MSKKIKNQELLCHSTTKLMVVDVRNCCCSFFTIQYAHFQVIFFLENVRTTSEVRNYVLLLGKVLECSHGFLSILVYCGKLWINTADAPAVVVIVLGMWTAEKP